MESNIGMVDRYFRLASGLVLLGTAMSMRKPSVAAKGALLGLGAMKIAEGATGWCPLIHLADTLSGSSNGAGSNHSTSQQKGTASSGRGTGREEGQWDTTGRTSRHSEEANSPLDGRSRRDDERQARDESVGDVRARSGAHSRSGESRSGERSERTTRHRGDGDETQRFDSDEPAPVH